MIDIKAGDLVVVSGRRGLGVHRVWGHKGPHVITTPLGDPSPSAGGGAWKWSRKTGTAQGGGAWILHIATPDDVAEYALAVATHIARRRVERCADPSLEAAVEAILEAAEQLHWLTGGE
jgi:hypothetical protein